METVSDLACNCVGSARNYGCGCGRCVHDQGVVRSVNANAGCRWNVPASKSLGDLKDTGGLASANGSANGDGYVHGHDYGTLPILAEHKTKPLSALEINCDFGKSNRTVKPVQDPPLLSPRICCLNVVPSQSPCCSLSIEAGVGVGIIPGE